MDYVKDEYDKDNRFKTGYYTVSGNWNKELTKVFIKNNYDSLTLSWNAFDLKRDSLKFLEDLPFLKRFRIVDRFIKDIRGVNSLRNLEELSIWTDCDTRIDFSNFPSLKYCDLDKWRKGSESIFACINLKQLHVRGIKETDFSGLAKLHNLEKLGLIHCAKLESLKGIEGLSKLREFLVAYARKLSDIDALEGMSCLELIEFDSCKNVEDFRVLKSLNNLRTLILNKLGKIDSLAFLGNCKQLEALSFTDGTVVEDGDIRFVESLDQLLYVLFENKKHYTHKMSDFQCNQTYNDRYRFFLA